MSLYIKAYELKCLIVAFLNAPIEFDLATVIGKLFHNLNNCSTIKTRRK